MKQRASILLTGGTGSFGSQFVPMTLNKYDPERLIIYSRDEMKQWRMAEKFQADFTYPILYRRRKRSRKTIPSNGRD